MNDIVVHTSFKTAQIYIMNDIMNDIDVQKAISLHDQNW